MDYKTPKLHIKAFFYISTVTTTVAFRKKENFCATSD